MENTNLDDTHPTDISPEAGEQEGLEEATTKRIIVEQETPPAGPEEIGETLRIPVQDEPVPAALPVGEAVPASPEVPETATVGQAGVGQPPRREARAGKPARKRRSWLLISFVGLLVLALAAVLSAIGGYMSGISMRQDAESTQVAQVIQEQFDLGVQEMQRGEYFRARQRFEYVIRLDPSYPGAVEHLADVLLELNTTATPTLVPTPTLTPTPDLRDVQDLYNQAQQFLLDGAWTSAIDTLLALRKSDPEYQKVDVDGMLFLALRNSGRDKILKEIDLEGGIYDLTLASNFGLLDTEAQSLLNWSTLYITGASFWELDWGQAVYYFGQVAPHAPNLMDKSRMTATQRYRIALVQYAKFLMNQKRFCEAQQQLEIALSINQDGETQSLYDQAAQRCATQNQP